MPTFDELEAAWLESPPPPRGRGRVDLLVVRKGGGVHQTPARVVLSPDEGLVGDRWAADDGDPKVQVTLMMTRVAELVCGGERPLHQPGDNVLVDLDLSEEALPVGSRVRVGGALVEVTDEPHLGCKRFSERFGPGALRWVNYKPTRTRRLRGVNCRIVEGGEVALGDPVELEPSAARKD